MVPTARAFSMIWPRVAETVLVVPSADPSALDRTTPTAARTTASPRTPRTSLVLRFMCLSGRRRTLLSGGPYGASGGGVHPAAGLNQLPAHVLGRASGGLGGEVDHHPVDRK